MVRDRTLGIGEPHGGHIDPAVRWLDWRFSALCCGKRSINDWHGHEEGLLMSVVKDVLWGQHDIYEIDVGHRYSRQLSRFGHAMLVRGFPGTSPQAK